MLLASLFAYGGSIARAEVVRKFPGDGGGTYGRFDHDFMLTLGAGLGHWDANGNYSSSGLAATGSVRLRYLDSAGPAVALHHRDGATFVFIGAEVRPLFPSLFLMNAFSGLEVFDLLVQSLSFELGAVVTSSSETESGALLALGFGLDVPLIPPSIAMDGIFMSLHARHVLGASTDRAGVSQAVAAWLFGAELTFKWGVFEGLSGWER